MTKTQFGFGITKLREVYGDGKYPEARTNLLYEKFKNIPADIYMAGINNMILACKFPPLLGEFYDEFSDALRVLRGETVTPSRLNKNAGYEKTENGVSGKVTSKAIGEILKGIL